MLEFFILSFTVSLGAAYLVLRWHHVHGHLTGDVVSRGSHQIHTFCVPRVGGVPIFAGWLAGLAAAVFHKELPFGVAASWVLCVLPLLAAGLAEDVVKRGLWKTRLLFSFVAAALAYVLLGAALNRVNVFGFDLLLGIPTISFIFTLMAVAGIAHGINIIDGLNGLATGVCLIALVAIGYVAFSVGDSTILLMSGLGAGAMLGLRVWNYPSGRIFCGDGGAYFGGLYVAILSVLLVNRHAEVSAWFPLLLLVYPVWETLFSAYRRRMRGLPASRADKLHIHTLFYKRVKYRLTAIDGGVRARRNSDASVSMLILASGGSLPAVLWWSETAYLVAAVVGYIALYLTLYLRIVRFGVRHKKRARTSSTPIAPVVRVASRRVPR